MSGCLDGYSRSVCNLANLRDCAFRLRRPRNMILRIIHGAMHGMKIGATIGTLEVIVKFGLPACCGDGAAFKP
eukprot:8006588-Pyramimonas_sp.AAC.1